MLTSIAGWARKTEIDYLNCNFVRSNHITSWAATPTQQPNNCLLWNWVEHFFKRRQNPFEDLIKMDNEIFYH